MIVQERDGGLLLFRQTDHALLSGAFAAAWGNDLVASPEPREAILVAASRHDDGWATWELSPTLSEDGRPVDFIRISVAEHVELYRRGIDLVEAEDPYAGLVVSMHGERLYTRPFYPGTDPRIEHLQGADLEHAKAYVSHELNRQARLRSVVGSDETPEEAWRLLQVWDRLSLLMCMEPPATSRRTMPPIASRSGECRIEVFGAEDASLRLDPYPFGDDPATFRIEAVRTEATRWDSVADYRRAFRGGEPIVVTFTCRAA